MSSTPSGMASTYPLTNIASTLISQIPTLVERLRQYDEQHEALDKRCETLEKEIVQVKKSLAKEQLKQKRLRERMDESDMGGSSYRAKRKRVDEEQEILRVVKPRIPLNDVRRASHQQLPSLDSCSSIVSLRSKRKGRVFSDEEACSIVWKSKRAKFDLEVQK